MLIRIGPIGEKAPADGGATCVGKHRKDRHAGHHGVRRFSDRDDSADFAGELAEALPAPNRNVSRSPATPVAARNAGGDGPAQASNDVPRR